MNFRPKSRLEPAGFQLTPMIDCIFLMLCFFLTSQVFSQWESEIDITLPTLAGVIKLSIVGVEVTAFATVSIAAPRTEQLVREPVILLILFNYGRNITHGLNL